MGIGRSDGARARSAYDDAARRRWGPRPRRRRHRYVLNREYSEECVDHVSCPRSGHPTLELRAPDCCTLVDDSVAIAALYRSLARRLTRSPWLNSQMTPVMRALVVENKWRAQRYGVHGTFVNESGTGAVSVAEMLDQVIEDVTPDAEALECLSEVIRCRAIVGAGTSADAQLAIFDAHKDSKSYEGALSAVTDWIAAATLRQD